MKKPVLFLLICLFSGMLYAFSGDKKSPAVSNSSIKKSERGMDKQTKDFQTKRRYSSLINSHYAKAQRKQQPKAQGKGL